MAICFSIETVCTWTMSTRFNLGWFFRMYWRSFEYGWNGKKKDPMFCLVCMTFIPFIQTTRKEEKEGKRRSL